MTTTVTGPSGKTLRRAGTVSATALALVLSGGGVAFAGLLPSPTDVVGTVTGTGDSPTSPFTNPLSGVTDSVLGTLTGALPATPAPSPSPTPSPLPAPVSSAVDTVTGAAAPVTGALAPVTSALAPLTDPIIGALPPILPTSPITGPGSSTQHDAPTAAPARTSAADGSHGTASFGSPTPTDVALPVQAALSHWTAPSAADLGWAPTVANAPQSPEVAQAQLAAGSSPQVAASDRIGLPHAPAGGLPGILIIAATIAVGVVAAGHVALFQQRLVGSTATS